jgi:hypothetical protein
MKTINDKDTVWHRARANGGTGLDDALFERGATQCVEVEIDARCTRILKDGKAWVPCPPEGNDWHMVLLIEDDEGRPAALWRRLKWAGIES